MSFEDEYDLDYLMGCMFGGLFLGVMLSMVTTSGIDGIGSTFWGAFGMTVAITFSIVTFSGAFIENKPKKALKLNGIIFRIILAIVSIAFFFIDYHYYWIKMVVAVIIVGELFYWIDKKKPSKSDNKLIFTAKRKGLFLLITSLIIMATLGFINLSRRIISLLKLNYTVIIKWIGIIGLSILGIVLVIVIVLGYIWLNSLKYKKK